MNPAQLVQNRSVLLIFRDCLKLAGRMVDHPTKTTAVRALIKQQFARNRDVIDQEQIRNLKMAYPFRQSAPSAPSPTTSSTPYRRSTRSPANPSTSTRNRRRKSRRTTPDRICNCWTGVAPCYNVMRKDPSLQEGWVEIHQQELPMLVKSESLSFEDAVMVRVFQSGQGYKLQLTSEMNISFFYSLVLTQKELTELVEQSLQDEPNWFRDIFSGSHRYELTVHSVETAALVVTQQQKFKNYELATFQLQMGDERRMRESLMYRYQRMKLRERMLDSYWENMCSVVRTKNPSLLLQLDSKIKRSAFK